MTLARRTFAATSLALAAALALPAASAVAQDKKEIVIGATAGPYADQVRIGIAPLLEKKGYRVKVVEFNDYIQPNFALAQGSLDANVFQHIVYLTKFATENKLPIIELLKVPTAPIALYSHKHQTLAVQEGAVVALPNDPTNAARALAVLQDIGWVKLRDGVDPIRASEKDVAVNIKGIKLVPIEAAQLPRSLDDTDYSFVNGNFALASGLKLTEALALEKTGPTYQNVVAIRAADKEKPWVQDLAAAYRSPEFLHTTETKFAGFVKTDYQQALRTTAAK
jgi:D-methionine transport system substrate-binding protein